MNKLRLLFRTEDGLIGLEKEIDFTPSEGLILYKPIIGKIRSVLYDENGFTAIMSEVAEPTNPDESLKYLIDIGFREYKL